MDEKRAIDWTSRLSCYKRFRFFLDKVRMDHPIVLLAEVGGLKDQFFDVVL
jgi:hypothetical protein